eukprot:GSChrysophyteH1.ASY1.ANO1.1675.1 assembled CDS
MSCRVFSDAPTSELSHIDSQNRPCMVDVSGKAITQRSATAAARVLLPPQVFDMIMIGAEGEAEIQSKKGPVFAAAIIAGTMAVKKTHDLIPFCHPLSVEHVAVQVGVDDQRSHCLAVRCAVRTAGKTGVEMEALTGASVAALCIYDMLKAVSHDIVVSDVRLLRKTGGKSDYDYVGREC